MRNEAAIARVIGMPRRTRTSFDSRTGDRWGVDAFDTTRRVPGMGAAGPRERPATTAPSTKGTMMARPIHTERMSQPGIDSGNGTNAKAITARRGQITPRIRSGHAAAAPTRADSHTLSRGLVRMLPSDREMRAKMACRIATVVPWAHAPSHASARASPHHEVDQSRHEGEGEEEMDQGARDMKRERPDAPHHHEHNGEQQEHGWLPQFEAAPAQSRRFHTESICCATARADPCRPEDALVAQAIAAREARPSKASPHGGRSNRVD